VAFYQRPPAVRLQQRGQNAHRCRLAGAVRAEHAEHRTARHRQVDAAQARTSPKDFVSPSTRMAGPGCADPELLGATASS
jgi:hypothetical protein